MGLKAQLQEDLKAAMRNKDELRKAALRLTLASIKNAEVEKKGELDEAETLGLLQTEIKRRRDAIAELEKAGRSETVAVERAELDCLLIYMPCQLSRPEIETAVRAVMVELDASGPAHMNQVMKRMMADLKGQADGKLVSQVVKELLSAN